MRFAILAAALLLCACEAPAPEPEQPPAQPATVSEYPDDPAEPHLRNLRQLTHAGQNAEAYFSADGTRLIFQSTVEGESACDQIFTMAVDGSDRRRVSTGAGRTTCGYFFPGGERILYASTHAHDAACPAPPDYSRGYVWPLDEYDIYTARTDGSDVRLLAGGPGYDAEATIAPDGGRIVFTSMRAGDLDIYTMAPDGSDVRRLTHEPGYDGGAFFSPDGSKIVYRGWHPTDATELADYRSLLASGLVRPTRMDLFVMDADGSNKVRVTELPGANFAPYFHPSGDRIIFASNQHDPTSRNFDLYMVGVDGSGLERVTQHGEFDGFPMFSPDGSRIVFASNRGAAQEGDTNIFIADWIEEPGRRDP
jgi:TolB protein